MKITNSHGNTYAFLIDRPLVISYFFGISNTVDKYIQAQ